MNSVELKSHCNEPVPAERIADLFARKRSALHLLRVTADRDHQRTFNPLRPLRSRLFCGFSNILCPDCARCVPNVILREGA